MDEKRRDDIEEVKYLLLCRISFRIKMKNKNKFNFKFLDPSHLMKLGMKWSFIDFWNSIIFTSYIVGYQKFMDLCSAICGVFFKAERRKDRQRQRRRKENDLPGAVLQINK